jgi:hypothetical protein
MPIPVLLKIRLFPTCLHTNGMDWLSNALMDGIELIHRRFD